MQSREAQFFIPKGILMNIIDFRFRPSTPDAVKGMLSNKVFGGMFELFKYADRARPEPIEKIVADMEKQGVVGKANHVGKREVLTRE